MQKRIDEWYHRQMSLLQMSDAPDVEEQMDITEERYRHLKRNIEHLTEGYTEEKMKLEQALGTALTNLQTEKEAAVADKLTTMGVGDTDARKMVHGEFCQREKEMMDSYQEKYAALQKKYDIPGGDSIVPVYPKTVTEDYTGWWESLGEIFDRYHREAMEKAADMVGEPMKIKMAVQSLDKGLEVRLRNRDFPDGVEEGFVSRVKSILLAPLKLPQWIWEKYQNYLSTRYDWLRDWLWERKVKKFDQNADPNTFIIPDGNGARNKEEFTAEFRALITLGFLLTLIGMVNIPIVSSVVGMLFSGVLSVLGELDLL